MTASTQPGWHPGTASGVPAYRPPRTCPVCGDGLQVTRLGCGSCGSELSGLFEACAFCGLADADRDLLRVFLTSRGNMREVERHLGVSYPTARQRYADLLARLGLESQDATAPATGRDPRPEPEPGRAGDAADRERILAQVAAGEIDVEAAADLLRQG